MISLLYASPNFLSIILVAIQAVIAYVYSIPVVSRSSYIPENREALLKGTLLLMIAFLLSMIVLAYGGRVLGLDILRVRVGLSFGFFLFVFIAVIIYWNLRRKLNIEDVF